MCVCVCVCMCLYTPIGVYVCVNIYKIICNVYLRPNLRIIARKPQYRAIFVNIYRYVITSLIYKNRAIILANCGEYCRVWPSLTPRYHSGRRNI